MVTQVEIELGMESNKRAECCKWARGRDPRERGEGIDDGAGPGVASSEPASRWEGTRQTQRASGHIGE